jgi:transporter family-2 protein
MKTLTLYILALSGGVFLAIQAGFNAHLSALLKQPVFAAITSSFFSIVFTGMLIFLTGRELPALNTLRQIPWYLWGIGGLFSVMGISLYFYTIPRLGISKMIALGLCGQLLFSLVAGMYGWLNLPLEPITTKRLIGTISLLTGIILINMK